MLRLPQGFLLSGVACALVLAVGILASCLMTGSSGAQAGPMHNCPATGKWSIAVWAGDSGTAAADALAACGDGAVAAAYSLDPTSGAWFRWFGGKPDVSNLPPLDDVQGVLALGSTRGLTATPTPMPTPTPTPEAGPELGSWKGTTSQGEDFDFEVIEGSRALVGSGKVVARGDTCTGVLWWGGSPGVPIPIVNNAFSYSYSGFEISGTFDSTTASGDLTYYQSSGQFHAECDSGPLTWTASAQAATAAGADAVAAAQGQIHNCPPAGKWSIAVWDGKSGTAGGDALATCGAGAVAAAYSLDPQTGGWSRWFAGKPDVSNLPPLDDVQGVLALGAAPTPTPTSSPTPTPMPTPTGETGYLPPPQEVGHISASGNAVVTTGNDTPYTLTVEFQGPTVQTITIPRCAACHEYSFSGPLSCPSGRPEVDTTLAPGEYTVTARVDDPSVPSFVGVWTLDEDTEYFQCFFIVTTFG